MSAAERRKNPRYPVDVPARVTAPGKSLAAHVRDICKDAVLVEADTWFPLGTQVALETELPGTGGSITLPGTITRLAPGEQAAHAMAVLFGDVPAAAALKIDLFIESRESQP